MIQERIRAHYRHHLKAEGRLTTKRSMYVADYNKQTGSKEGVKLFDCPPPTEEIKCFILNNPRGIEITGLPFDKMSFVKPEGGSESQCECVIYPEENDETSWICFIELKYTEHKHFKRANEARKQLHKTQAYYRSKGIFGEKNTCYLLASLPQQKDPIIRGMKNFLRENIPSSLDEKSESNAVVIHVCNSAEILNHNKLLV